MKSSALLSQLSNEIEIILKKVETDFRDLSPDDLNHKESQQHWSILECFEHLNRYSRFYHTEFERAVNGGIDATVDEDVKSTWLGKKFIDMMRPQNVKKQKTFSRMNPANSTLDILVFDEFFAHQKTLLAILQRAQRVSLVKTTVRVEFFHLLKMNLGDAFQFVVVHTQRHLQQAERILATRKNQQEAFLKV